MPPLPAVSPLSAAVRVCGATLACGGLLPTVAWLGGHGPAARLGVLAIAVAGLAYLGTLRASLTHGASRRLAVQTVGAALPCVLMAWFAGANL